MYAHPHKLENSSRTRVAWPAVCYLEALHCLVLGDGPRAVVAADELGMATTVLVSASITPFLGHTAQEEGDRSINVTSFSIFHI